MGDGVSVAAIVPLLLIGVAFLGYCLYDLAHQSRTRYLPRAAWAVITLLSIPLGGIVYLLFGRPSTALRGSDDA